MSLASSLYSAVFKRNSVFVGTIFFSAFAFSLSYDTITQRAWEAHNRGKLWKDIRDKVQAESNSS